MQSDTATHQQELGSLWLATPSNGLAERGLILT